MNMINIIDLMEVTTRDVGAGQR